MYLLTLKMKNSNLQNLILKHIVLVLKTIKLIVQILKLILKICRISKAWNTINNCRDPF